MSVTHWGMQKVSDKHHLIRRNGVYYYSRRVPDYAVAAVGRRTIRYSLKTRDKKKATRLREVDDLTWSARFAEIERNAEDQAVNGASIHQLHAQPLTAALATRLVQDYVAHMDAQTERGLAADPPETAAEKHEIENEARETVAVLTKPGHPQGVEMLSRACETIVQQAGVTHEGYGGHYAQFVELVRRGLLELEKRKVARVEGDYGQDYFDALFNPAARVAVSFGELADQFLELRIGEARENRTSEKHLDRLRASVALVREIVGKDTPVRDVDYDAALRVRAMLARTPVNRNKVYPGIPIEKAVERAKAEGRDTLSPVSQERYLGAFRDLLDLGLRKRLIPSNPAEGLRPLKRDDVAASEKRLPFSIDQLQALFRSNIYVDCAKTGPIPYRHATKTWEFWLPLICLFTGMRPNEVCQLRADDIQQTKAGTWFIRIEASDAEQGDDGAVPKRTLKTASSKRRIPVHSELQAVGFLEFVAERRKVAKTARLFPELKPNTYGNLAWYALKLFNEVILPKAVPMKPRQSFYSLRHSFRDALRRFDASAATLNALGWSQGKTVSDAYGDKYDPDTLAKQIAKVTFPGLDVSHLYVNR